MKPALYIKTTLLFAFLAVGSSQANTISFDTSIATQWAVTAGGAVNATPYHRPAYPQFIYITSGGDSTGTFVPGGSLANFDGFWTADFTFTLPADATNIRLNYGNFYADDRAVLTLNG
jgi:hypothetical protein